MVIDVEVEKREIIGRYRRLLRKAKPVLKEGDAKLIKRAFTISMEAHKDMRRKSGEPYIFHPLSVAEICVEEIGLGTTSIVAALLHDVERAIGGAKEFFGRVAVFWKCCNPGTRGKRWSFGVGDEPFANA